MLPHGISITLVEPKGPVNLGHVARLVQNFGVDKLYLVNPKADVSVASIYASHAAEVLDRAIVTNFEAVRRENEMLVATTAVRATKKSNVVRRMVRPERLHEILASSCTSSIVFGRDSTGLTNEEIRMCDATTTIDASPEYRSLNVGHAVAILLYLASQGRAVRRREQGRTARDVFARSLHELTGVSGISEHRTKDMYEVGKRLAAASEMTDAQLNMLSGVFRKAVSAIEGGQSRGSNT